MIRFRRGDTLIEVMMSFAIFSIVVLIAINSMNSGVSAAEASLELTLARSEINAQAEAIRFIHNSFLNDREIRREDQEYLSIWGYLRSRAIDVDKDEKYPLVSDLAAIGCNNVFSTDDALNGSESIYKVGNSDAFIVNTREIKIKEATAPDEDIYSTIVRAYSEDGKNTKEKFRVSSLNPRIIYKSGDSSSTVSSDGALYGDASYTTIAYVEGLWDIAIKGSSYGTGIETGKEKPGYYDFHLNACWNAPGNPTPTTLSTVIRLYNPEYLEEEVNDKDDLESWD